MPAALNVDKQAAQVLCLAIGVREAARQMGIPEPTMQAWSARGNWLASTRPQPPTAPPPASQIPTTVATKPADALVNRLASDSTKTRIGLSTATLKAAKTFAKRTGGQVIGSAQQLRHVVAAASTLHGWEERKEQGLTLNLGVIAGGMS